MDYNPFSPEVRENPYPYYADLRRHAPVYQVPGVGMWAVSRYDDVMYMLKNPQLFSSSVLAAALLGDLNPAPEVASLISSDPPAHTRLRKLVNRAFTPRMIAGLELRIREITNQLLARVASVGEFDLIRDLATPLPVIVIAELLGVEPERRDDFKRWSDDLVIVTNGGAAIGEERERIRQSIAEFFAYFRSAIEVCRKEPSNNLISDLVRAEEEHQALTLGEILNLTGLLLVAGNETTTNLIGNAVLALFEHPGELAKVRANFSLLPNVVEETLRYDGPIQLLLRQATQEIELAGTSIPAGALVMPLFASANRDERRFSDPDRFDITRDTEGHTGFGFGIHYCLGSQLARLEAKVALDALLRQFPRLSRKDDQVTWVESFIVRGPKTLPLVVS